MNAVRSHAIRNVVREFLLTEFLQGEDESNLDDTTPLITGGILDSIGAVRIVMFLEQTFDIEIPQVEVGNFNSVQQIVETVQQSLEDKNI